MYDPSKQHYPQLFDDTSSSSNYGYQGGGGNYGFQDQNFQNTQYMRSQNPYDSNQQQANYGIPGAQLIQDPLVANVAMQYGQNLVGQGREFVDQKLEKIVSVSKVKYYFAVDTKYVLKKLRLILFPFGHSEWNICYNREDDEPVQPRYDINAPDLYIPLMAFLTYVLVAGLCLGLQQRFSPDELGIQASWSVVWMLIELGVIYLSLYVTAVTAKMHILHLLSLCSYKYVGMVISLTGGIFMDGLGYYFSLVYCSLTLIAFLFQTLRCQFTSDSSSLQNFSVGTKRRFYLLMLICGIQPLMMWVLTKHFAITRPTPPDPYNNSL